MARMTPGRRALHAYVYSEQHEAWHEFAASVGTSVSALLCGMIDEIEAGGMDERTLLNLGEVVKRARQHDSRNRRRSKDGDHQ